MTQHAESGYRASLRARDGMLVEPDSGAVHAPESLRVDEMIRFESDTDPNEQALVFVLSRADGTRLGSYTVAYGPVTPPEDAAVVTRLQP